MAKPLLFDGYCCQGGAGAGYERAGWHTVGCDIDPKPLRHNPHECYQGDVLAVLDTLLNGGMWHGYRLSDFQAIHCSPPCQHESTLKSLVTHYYPALLAPTRDFLVKMHRATGIPWILENVATAAMHQGIEICGTALGLNVRRHRRFDSSHLLYGPGMCHHSPDNINVYGHSAWNYHKRTEEYRHWHRHNANQCPVPIAVAKIAFEAPWMTQHGLAECIPPAYTAFLGAQLLSAIGADSEVA